MKNQDNKEHNKIKYVYFSALFISVVLFFSYLFWVNSVLINTESNNNQNNLKCFSDSDCIPAECCHPTSCTTKENAPDCVGVMCTMECREGTMDCGGGSCGCVNNKCIVIN